MTLIEYSYPNNDFRVEKPLDERLNEEVECFCEKHPEVLAIAAVDRGYFGRHKPVFVCLDCLVLEEKEVEEEMRVSGNIASMGTFFLEEAERIYGDGKDVPVEERGFLTREPYRRVIDPELCQRLQDLDIAI